MVSWLIDKGIRPQFANMSVILSHRTLRLTVIYAFGTS